MVESQETYPQTAFENKRKCSIGEDIDPDWIRMIYHQLKLLIRVKPAAEHNRCGTITTTEGLRHFPRCLRVRIN